MWLRLSVSAFLTLLLCSAAVSQRPDTKKEPIADLTVGWTYLWADQGNNYRSNLNGFYIRPAVTLGRGYSLFFDSTNYYGRNAKGSVNSHGYTLGLAEELFTRPHIEPSIFVEAGDVRSWASGVITNQLATNLGVSFSVPIRDWVSLAVTPAEYIFLYPNSDWRNDYNAKIGLAFAFGKR